MRDTLYKWICTFVRGCVSLINFWKTKTRLIVNRLFVSVKTNIFFEISSDKSSLAKIHSSLFDNEDSLTKTPFFSFLFLVKPCHTINAWHGFTESINLINLLPELIYQIDLGKFALLSTNSYSRFYSSENIKYYLNDDSSGLPLCLRGSYFKNLKSHKSNKHLFN